MADVVSFIVCGWIAWGPLLHIVALICGIVFSCSPSQAWCQCSVFNPILMLQCTFYKWCTWGVVHVPLTHTWFRNCPSRVWNSLVFNCVSKKWGPNFSVGSLSCWVSFPEACWPINLPEVIRTCRYWVWYTMIHSYLLFPLVYICWWSRRGFPWCWCKCITSVWVGSWGKSSICPWSWTWRFL